VVPEEHAEHRRPHRQRRQHLHRAQRGQGLPHQAAHNAEVNKWWITDEVRYGWKFVHAPSSSPATTPASGLDRQPTLRPPSGNARSSSSSTPTRALGESIAQVVLPGATFAEKAGTWENCNGLLQSFEQAIPTQHQAKSEAQIALDLLAIVHGEKLREHTPGFGATIVDEQPGQVPAATDAVSMPRGPLFDPPATRVEMAASGQGPCPPSRRTSAPPPTPPASSPTW
jgi:hypothetical protein